MKEFIRKQKIPILLFLIFFVAIFFRFYQLNQIPPGLYSDEAVNGSNTIEAIYGDGPKVFYTDNNGREGLFINIQALSVKLFGTRPWALRAVSGVFGSLTVLGLYFLTKELFKKKRVALFAAFFLATSFWHINFSRIGFRAIMAPFFLVWSCWLLWKFINTHNQLVSKWKSNVQIIISGLLFGLGFHSYISYRVAPLLLLPPLVLFIKNKRFKEMAFFSIAVLIAISPLVLYFYHNPSQFLGRTSQISIFSDPSPVVSFLKNTGLTIGMFFVAGDANWRHNYVDTFFGKNIGAPELFWPVAILFFIGVIWSLKNVCKRNENLDERSRYAFLWIWIVTMLLPVVISNEGIPHALRAIIVTPVAMIIAALGLEWVIEKFFQKNPKVFTFCLAFLLALITFNAYNTYFIKWAHNPNVASAFNTNVTQDALYLASIPQESPKWVVMDSDNGLAPMSAHIVSFITNSYLPFQQKEKNIRYIFKRDLSNIPEDPSAIKIWIQ